jgi:cytochrome c oxidase assembly factor CtaG
VKSSALLTPKLISATLLVGFGVLLLTTIGLVVGGGAEKLDFSDTGPLVRWGQPLIKGLMNLSMAVSIGSLVFAVFALENKSQQLKTVLNLASVASVFWTLTAAANFLLTYLSVSGAAFSFEQSFSEGMWVFATEIELGTSLTLNFLAALTLSVLTLMVSSLVGSVLLASLGLAALVPMALIGHAAGTENHSLAVNALGLHLVGIVIWVGGLFALFSLRGNLRSSEESQSNIAIRYSSLALVSFILVSVSGITSTYTRLDSLSGLISPYGFLLAGKIVALLLLGVFGAIYRKKLLTQLKNSSNFYKLVVLELFIMGCAIGLGTALAKTAPPLSTVGFSEPTPAELLTGEALPPELTLMRLFTENKIDILWLVIGVGAIWFYLAGVRRLRRRGDSWQISRTLSWVGGMLLLIFITSGSLNAYQEYLFSVHMVSHMMLTMAVPVLLVPGAPVTLLMRAVDKRTDESRGVREWVLWAVHTRYAQFISHPVVAAVLFASSLVVFYFTPIFEWTTREHLGHQWMIVHFLITGYLFVQALIGVDPGPTKIGYPLRIVMLIAVMAFHAFFGLAIMGGSGLLLADWYGAMGRTWGLAPLEDQQSGGAIAWGIGELPTVALTIIVSVQWYISDRKDAKRLDRASDRTGNQDVENYNEMLANLAGLDQKRKP